MEIATLFKSFSQFSFHVIFFTFFVSLYCPFPLILPILFLYFVITIVANHLSISYFLLFFSDLLSLPFSEKIKPISSASNSKRNNWSHLENIEKLGLVHYPCHFGSGEVTEKLLEFDCRWEIGDLAVGRRRAMSDRFEGSVWLMCRGGK